MPEVEIDQHEFDAHSGVPIARLEVGIPGLRPERHSLDGKLIRPSNLRELAEETRKIFTEKPWYRPLLRDIRQGNKSAVFIAALGGITIFVAAAAGFEFGIRHGQDLRNLPRILKRRK